MKHAAAWALSATMIAFAAYTQNESTTELAAEKQEAGSPAPVLTAKMTYIQRGTIESKSNTPRGDNLTTIRYEGATYTIINHPSYFDLALEEQETCIVVRGQVDKATGRRLYHYFSENTMTEADIANFKKRCPGVPLD